MSSNGYVLKGSGYRYRALRRYVREGAKGTGCNASALVHTNQKTAPLADHHYPYFLVQSIRQIHSFHTHLVWHLGLSFQNPVSPASDSVGYGRIQHQAVYSIILQSAAAAAAAPVAVCCNALTKLTNQLVDRSINHSINS